MMRWKLRVKNFLNRGVFPLKNIALKHIPMYHRERAGMGSARQAVYEAIRFGVWI